MSRITIGSWGEGLVVPVPDEIAHAAGLAEGQQVDIEIKGDDIILRRSDAKAKTQARAEAALERMVELSKTVSLEGLSIRDLIDEGRR